MQLAAYRKCDEAWDMATFPSDIADNGRFWRLDICVGRLWGVLFVKSLGNRSSE